MIQFEGAHISLPMGAALIIGLFNPNILSKLYCILILIFIIYLLISLFRESKIFDKFFIPTGFLLLLVPVAYASIEKIRNVNYIDEKSFFIPAAAFIILYVLLMIFLKLDRQKHYH